MIREGEWILTSGTGGYALGRGNFINDRKYHSLLVAVYCRKRINVIPSLEEKVLYLDGEVFLDSNHYPSVIYPDGWQRIVESWLRPFPGAIYRIAEGIQILKEVRMVEGEDSTVVTYRNLSSEPLNLEIRPKFALRDHHFLNQPGSLDGVNFIVEQKRWGIRVRREDNGFYGFIFVDRGSFSEERLIYRNVQYPLESARGYDSVEDLFSPGKFLISLSPNEDVNVVISSREVGNLEEVVSRAQKRYIIYPQPYYRENEKIILRGEYLFDLMEYRQLLPLLGKDFLCCDRDIIAGYPWFFTWGRDSMISLEGVRYLEGGEDFGIRVLRFYAEKMRDGIIPNVVYENGGGNYETVDASLWFVLRLAEFMRGEEESEEALKWMGEVIYNYMFNKNLKFKLDEDGLIKIRDCNSSLTWMDARVYDVPVTPRCGKPVEVEALWINALVVFKEMVKEVKMNGSNSRYNELLFSTEEIFEKAVKSMTKFVDPESGRVYDRLDSEDMPVREIRPNMVIAASLPFDVFPEYVNRKIFEVAKKELLTPFGLRTLSPESPSFRRKYIGNQRQRDLAYHQGSVWPYLLTFFAKLIQKIHRDDRRKIIENLKDLVWIFREKIKRGDYASIPELYDGEDPSVPRGAPAQAWSVFALLEIEEIIRSLT